MRGTPKQGLAGYYAIEGITSFGCTLFQQGIFFWAAAVHGFTATENLLLGATQGLVYILTAAFGGKASDRWGYDRVLMVAMVGIGLVNVSLWMLPIHAAPFILAALFVAMMGPFWPSLEANVMHVAGTVSVPKRLGLYNLVWSATGALGFFTCGFLVKWRMDAIIWIPGLLMLAQIPLLLGRKAHALAQDGVDAHAEAGGPDRATRRRFMHLHWLSNSLGYFMMNGLAALLPMLGERLGLTASGIIWLTCSYLFARALAFLILMLWEGWHYRAGWSLAALLIAPVCLAAMFFAPSAPYVLAAGVVFGFALGLSYSGSLYYSMNYGDSKGEHGGLHEAILGGGILTGPLAGAGASALFGATGAQAALVGIAALVSLVGPVLLRSR